MPNEYRCRDSKATTRTNSRRRPTASHRGSTLTVETASKRTSTVTRACRMPTLDEEIALNVSEDDAAQACRTAISKLGWNVVEESDAALVAEEAYERSTSDWFPVNLRLRIIGNGRSTSVVLLSASIAGYGPLERNHLRRQLDLAKAHVALAVMRGRAGEHTALITAELQRHLGEVQRRLMGLD